MVDNEVKEIIEKLFLNQDCGIVESEVAKKVVYEIVKLPLSELINIISNSNYKPPEISAANISQFSKFEDVNKVITIVMDSGYENITFIDLGYFLIGKKSDHAKRKYGENHYKLASQLGFTTDKSKHDITWLGIAYREWLNDEEKKIVAFKLSLRLPLIQKVFIIAQRKEVNVSGIMLKYLSESTMKRRRSNIKKMISGLEEYSDKSTKFIFKNIRWEL